MKLLMHMCCGPCSVYPSKVLKEEDIDFEGLFLNPNIHPFDEFVRRKENAVKLANIRGFKVNLMDDFRQQDWEQFEGTDENRCSMCYSSRLGETARIARENGFDAFTTTLLVSPYQKHFLIKELGEKFAKKYGLDFYYRDYRPGFRQGQQEAKEMGLYRQKYCGCIISRRQ